MSFWTDFVTYNKFVKIYFRTLSPPGASSLREFGTSCPAPLTTRIDTCLIVHAKRSRSDRSPCKDPELLYTCVVVLELFQIFHNVLPVESSSLTYIINVLKKLLPKMLKNLRNSAKFAENLLVIRNSAKFFLPKIFRFFCRISFAEFHICRISQFFCRISHLPNISILLPNFRFAEINLIRMSSYPSSVS